MDKGDKTDDVRILAEIKASPPRRWLGVGTLTALGVLMVYVTITAPPVGLHWQAFLLGGGIAALMLAQSMWRATQLVLILSDGPDGMILADSSGEIVARVDQVTRVERGMFAMKPSNGFSMRLEQPGVRIWRPGLWWRWGKRVAIGGVTSGAQTRPVADILQMQVSLRAG